MARADDIKALQQDMTMAFEERKEALGSIKEETARLIEDVAQLRSGIKNNLSELKTEVAGMLTEFHKERVEIAAAWSEFVSVMKSKRSAEPKRHTKHAPAGSPQQVSSRGIKQGKAHRTGAIS